MYELFQRFDAHIARIERVVVVLALGIMVLLVCSAVFVDLFNNENSKWLPLLERAFNAQGNTERTHTLNRVAHSISAILWTVLCILAVHKANPRTILPRVIYDGFRIAQGTILLGLLSSWLLPHGIVFSQKLSLGLFMWVVLFGASLAAFERRHIVLQALQKALQPEHLQLQAALGSFCAAAFTLFLVWPCTLYTIDLFDAWVETEHYGAVLESLPSMPLWLITLSFPLGFSLTGLRFMVYGFGILRGTLPPLPPHTELTTDETVPED